MVIELFKDGDPERIGERFRRNGRMLPEDIAFHESWVDSTGTRCFMIMEAPHAELLRPWVNRWGGPDRLRDCSSPDLKRVLVQEASKRGLVHTTTCKHIQGLVGASVG